MSKRKNAIDKAINSYYIESNVERNPYKKQQAYQLYCWLTELRAMQRKRSAMALITKELRETRNKLRGDDLPAEWTSYEITDYGRGMLDGIELVLKKMEDKGIK